MTDYGESARLAGDPETTPETEFPAVPLDALSAEEMEEISTGPEASLWRDAWRQLRRNPSFVIGGVLVLVYLFIALFPQVIAPQGIGRELCDTAAGPQPPSSEYIFGLDDKGCPYYPRVIYGARPSLIIGPSVALFALALAMIFGTLAGYYGGLLDTLIARATDVVLAIPTVLGALVFITAFRDISADDPTVAWPIRAMSSVFEAVDSFTGVKGIGLVVFILTMLGWTTMLRLARSTALTTKNADYVEAARALGGSDFRIMRKHIIPNSIAPVLVYATIMIGVAIVSEATLSFLGVGLKIPTVSWGLQLSAAQSRLQSYPHLMFFPAVALAVLVFSFILIGDAVRDALDPKLR